MKLKTKSFLIINITLLASIILFFGLIEGFGKKYYLYQKRLILDKVERNLELGTYIQKDSDIIIAEIPILTENFEFNQKLKYALFKKDSWKYEFWFGEDALSILEKTGRVTRVFKQKNLKSSFLIRVFKKNEKYIILQISISSIEENLNLMKEFSLYIFLAVSLLIWSIYTLYFRSVNKNIKRIESSLEKISRKEFEDIDILDSKDEFENISLKILKVSKDLKEYIDFLNKRYDSQKYFYNSLAHELKTPITVITGYTYFIKEILEDEDKKYCDFILKECIGISQMGKRFQMLAENSKELKISTFDLDKLLRECVERFSLEFHEKELKITSTSILFLGDYDLLKVAVDNLISNALKFSKKIIKIKLELLEDRIELTIFNDGEKIEPKHIDKIWQPFFYLEKNEKVDNWGLGLSLVADIVKRHGGEYFAENRNYGVEFKLIFRREI